MKPSGRVFILEHPHRLLGLDQSHYVARHLAARWRQQGIEILRGFDPAALPPADALFLHVDLSLLPPTYCGLAEGFCAAINAEITDIRKRTLSLNQVVPGDGYAGPVIIKTSLNHAGGPERNALIPDDAGARRLFHLRNKWRRWWERLGGLGSGRLRASTLLSKEAYCILPSIDRVPEACFADPDVVIERFTPEYHDGRYVLREWYFLGEAEFVRTEVASHPVITSGEYRADLTLEVPANLRRLRREWRIDYGKIDYVMKDGEAVVFDVNKTPCFPGPPVSEPHQRLIEALAPGIALFLPGERASSRAG